MTSIQKFEALCDRILNTLSSPRFIVWAIPLILVTRLLSTSPADPDLFARIAMGHLTLTNASVPLTDPFAFTKVLPMWVDHEWLAGVVFYLVSSASGDVGLIALRVLLAILAVLCVIHASERHSPVFRARFIWISLCILHAAAAWTSTIRCQAFTYLFIPFLYWAAIEYRSHRNIALLRISPIVAVIWVNMHGGFALGCCIIGLLCLTELAVKRLSLGLIAVAAGWAIAPVFTPYGFTVFVTFLLDSLGMERPGIVEWEPLYKDVPSFIATIVLTLPLLYGMVVKRKTLDLFAVGSIIFSGYCAFRHTRFLAFFMITAAIFGGPYIEITLNRLREIRLSFFLASVRSGAISIVLLLAVGAAKLVLILGTPSTYKLDFAAYPIGAVEWLRNSGLSGNLLVNFNEGSFAMWRLYPKFKISVDGRYEEAYPQETVTDNALALSPNNLRGREALERINPTHILASLKTPETDPAALFGNGWKVIYRDPTSAVLSREANEASEPPVNYNKVPLDMWTPLF